MAELGPVLDPGVSAAVQGALFEALNNIVKHAGVDWARLTWLNGREGWVDLEDEGRGFDASAGWTGGAQGSVTARCLEAGVQAALVSAPEHGTRVTLTWTHVASTAGARTNEANGIEPVLGHVALNTALAVGALGAVSTLFLPAGPPRAGSALAVVAVAALGGAAWRTTRGRATIVAPWILFIGALVALWLPGAGLTGCARVDDWIWGTQASLVFVVAAIVIDGRAWVIGQQSWLTLRANWQSCATSGRALLCAALRSGRRLG